MKFRRGPGPTISTATRSARSRLSLAASNSPLTVNGKTFNGVMPAWSLSDEDIAKRSPSSSIRTGAIPVLVSRLREVNANRVEGPTRDARGGSPPDARSSRWPRRCRPTRAEEIRRARAGPLGALHAVPTREGGRAIRTRSNRAGGGRRVRHGRRAGHQRRVSRIRRGPSGVAEVPDEGAVRRPALSEALDVRPRPGRGGAESRP